MAGPKWIEQLSKSFFEYPLTGIESHALMAPLPHRLKEDPGPTARTAGVLILLYEDDRDFVFPLIRRSAHPGDPHKGQISLPGGRQEETDSNLAVTAIRESSEEIGVNTENILIVGSLSTLFIPVSQNIVHPYVAYYTGTPNFQLGENEVEELIPIRLHDLLVDQNIEKRTIKTSYSDSIEVPGFVLDGHWVWGATAMILMEFKSHLLKMIGKGESPSIN